ncbi:hypothetical protein I4U23_011788 [Adineta vaga]|nr:hypothetical protein I4U23_011788 [Adineta vaga]
MGEARFQFNAKAHQPIIDLFRDRQIKPLQENLGRVGVDSIKIHVKFLMKKLFIIIFLFLIGIIGIVSLIFGVIAYNRHCYLPRQPSIPIWLIVLGAMSIILVTALILLILVATVIKYNTSEKAFRRAFIFTVGMCSGVLSWSIGPGSQAMFYLSPRSSECLGYVKTYGEIVYIVLCICSIIYGIYCGYKTWKHFCGRKKGNTQVTVVPVAQLSDTQQDLPNATEVSVTDETSTSKVLPPLKDVNPTEKDTIPVETKLSVDSSMKIQE